MGGWINLMRILSLKNIYKKIAKNFQGLTFKIGERNHKYGNHPGGGGGRGEEGGNPFFGLNGYVPLNRV